MDLRHFRIEVGVRVTVARIVVNHSLQRLLAAIVHVRSRESYVAERWRQKSSRVRCSSGLTKPAFVGDAFVVPNADANIMKLAVCKQGMVLPDRMAYDAIAAPRILKDKQPAYL